MKDNHSGARVRDSVERGDDVAAAALGADVHPAGDRTAQGDTADMRRALHDGLGVWCAARRLKEGRFVWPHEAPARAIPMALTQAQFDALVLGLPWQRLEQIRVISRMQTRPQGHPAGQSEHLRMAALALALHNACMLGLQGLNAQDLQGLSPSSLAEVAAQMLTRIGEQCKFIGEQSQQLDERDKKMPSRRRRSSSRTTGQPAAGGAAVGR